MIKIILKLREESDTYVTHICRHHWSIQQILIHPLHHDLSAPAISTNMSPFILIHFLTTNNKKYVNVIISKHMLLLELDL